MGEGLAMTWKSKLFGDNRLNFYGWIVAGLVVFGISIAATVIALNADDAKALRSPVCLLLVAIYFVLLGHFGIALQNYCSRVAKNIELEDKKRDEAKNKL